MSTSTAAVIPLDEAPWLRRVAAPTLSGELADQLAAEQARIAASPSEFDGPQLMVKSYNAKEIEVFDGLYSHYRLQRKLGRDDTPLGFGGLGVGLVIKRGGQELWAQRSASVLWPNSWAYALSGSVEPGDTLTSALAREVEEEYGISTESLCELKPLALLDAAEFPPYVAFTAILPLDVELQPSPEEIQRLVWTDRPLADLAPLSPPHEAIYRLLAHLL